MKKRLLTILIFAISLLISSMAIAGNNYGNRGDGPNHGDIEDCDALDGEAYELCESYCFAKACATDDPNGNPKSCARLKENYMNATGNDILPCDIVACAVCGDQDPDNQLATIGECEEMKAVDCAPPMVSAGQVSCDVVTIPAVLQNYPAGVGCDNIDPNNIMGAMYPDCQNGMPGWVCNAFLKGSPLDDPAGCPAPPSCLD